MISIEGLKQYQAPSGKSLAIISTALAVFSLFYWISAYFKPFHVDEFYSWVYAQRCTFKEIFLLKDGGIGHPPLYHLLQKIIIEIVPSYHFLHLRVVNYFSGLVFVALLVKILYRYSNHALFAVAAVSSSAILNVFVFSRMWGLVCLSSLLLVILGEKYLNEENDRLLPAIGVVCIVGHLSDYNFILMMPYIFLIYSIKKFNYNSVKSLYGFLLFIFLSTAIFKISKIEGTGISIFYNIITDYVLSIPQIFFETTFTFLNFWFLETFVISIMIIFASFYINWKKEKGKIDGSLTVLTFAIGMVILHVILKISPYIRVRYSGIVVIFSLIVFWHFLRRANIWNVTKLSDRIIHSIAGGMIILLTISPYFYKNLIDSRFLALFLPCIFMWMISIGNKQFLTILSIILIISGVIYLSSNGIAENYPPPVIDNSGKFIFQDYSSYANQYIKKFPNILQDPVFLDVSAAYKSCRVCAMGTKIETITSGKKIFILGREDGFNLSEFKNLNGLVLNKKCVVGLSFSDKIQFKYLTPIRTWRHSIFEFEKLDIYNSLEEKNSSFQ
ncbi:MAG: hypothetical protein R2940_06335 [Syntrophotaleaceae bacterium]